MELEQGQRVFAWTGNIFSLHSFSFCNLVRFGYPRAGSISSASSSPQVMSNGSRPFFNKQSIALCFCIYLSLKTSF